MVYPYISISAAAPWFKGLARDESKKEMEYVQGPWEWYPDTAIHVPVFWKIRTKGKERANILPAQ